MRRVLFVLAPFIAIVIAVIILAWGHSATETANADVDGPGTMALVVKQDGVGICDSNSQPPAPIFEEKCVLEKGSFFDLSIELKDRPAGGYIAINALVRWTGQPTKDQLNFIEGTVKWPECELGTFNIKTPALNDALMYCQSSFSPPGTTSFFKGNVFNFTFECKPGTGEENIRFDLIPLSESEPDGSALFPTFFVPPETVPPASLKIACMTPKQPWPGDTDGDGCPDANENQDKSEHANGGGRDYLNPYDWYDINQDGVIDLFFDILGVIQHYSLDTSPPYDVIYDRGPSLGPNSWNMVAPDDSIDLFFDILGVIAQYSLKGCTEDPAA